MALYEVRYEDQHLKTTLEALESHLAGICADLQKEIDDEAKEKIREWVRFILSDILFLYKNKEYAAEGEIRMFSLCLPCKGIEFDEGEREGGFSHTYIPTPPFLFRNSEYEIIIGPKLNDKYAARLEVEHLLGRYGLTHVKVWESKIPYR